MVLHGVLVVALRLSIPSAVIPAVGRPARGNSKRSDLWLNDNRRVMVVLRGARSSDIPPKAVYALRDLPSGAVHACHPLDKLRDFYVTSKAPSVTRVEVF